MRGEFGNVVALDVPDMHESIFAAGDDVLGVRGEVALDDGGLVEEVGELEELVALESVQQDDAVVRCSQHQVLSVRAEPHYLYLVVVLPPLSEWPGLAALYSVEADPHDLLVLLLLRPRNSKRHTGGIEASDWKCGHAFSFYAEFEFAL